MGSRRAPVRALILASAGLAALYVASQWSGRYGAAGSDSDADSVVGTAAPMPSRAPAASTPSDAHRAAAADAPLGRPDRSRVVPDSSGDPFVTHSWLPPVAPPTAPSPLPPPKPAAPVVPPLPFAFVGMLESGAARPQAFLAKGETLLIVSAGDTLENNTYRVESLSPQQVVVTYLPMNAQQTIVVSGANP